MRIFAFGKLCKLSDLKNLLKFLNSVELMKFLLLQPGQIQPQALVSNY